MNDDIYKPFHEACIKEGISYLLLMTTNEIGSNVHLHNVMDTSFIGTKMAISATFVRLVMDDRIPEEILDAIARIIHDDMEIH